MLYTSNYSSTFPFFMIFLGLFTKYYQQNVNTLDKGKFKLTAGISEHSYIQKDLKLKGSTHCPFALYYRPKRCPL